ncbi:hypothetical protein SCOCK_150075 [Actinacidiphila cocklensis]|jgi:hypothetical protein|uniref:Uncharacterized protein n=1 Tax=Actinacidiphila cocklensis TaxID=887465 RepID=A0A9W4DM05_9ACTN|nr:hypothetical protein SCOCK_150075 [Actinacidiphila cocklensis]
MEDPLVPHSTVFGLSINPYLASPRPCEDLRALSAVTGQLLYVVLEEGLWPDRGGESGVVRRAAA